MTDDRRNDADDDAAPLAGDDAPTGGEMNDTRFDAWLHAASRDYNRPGDTVPRDAMWSAIERSFPSTVVPMRSHRRANVWWQAAAAILLVAGGIAIGRQWSNGGTATMAQQGANDGRPSGGDAAASRPIPTTPQVASSTLPSDPSASPNTRDAATDGSAAGSRRAATSGSNGSYDMATLEHLSRAEALLTSFRTPRSAGDGTPLNSWARDLLADTRLLLDSPAATDARRRQLLEDLELVLAQIVQLPAESSADRGLVQRSIERGAVLSRLRSSIPAGFASGT